MRGLILDNNLTILGVQRTEHHVSDTKLNKEGRANVWLVVNLGYGVIVSTLCRGVGTMGQDLSLNQPCGVDSLSGKT